MLNIHGRGLAVVEDESWPGTNRSGTFLLEFERPLDLIRRGSRTVFVVVVVGGASAVLQRRSVYAFLVAGGNLTSDLLPFLDHFVNSRLHRNQRLLLVSPPLDQGVVGSGFRLPCRRHGTTT